MHRRNTQYQSLECLEVILIVKKFRPYIEGYKYKAGWSLKLQGYDFFINYEKDSRNVVPNALSRTFENDDEELVNSL